MDDSGAVLLRDERDANHAQPLNEEELAEFNTIAAELTMDIPYCPVLPNPGPQTMFLLDFGRESLYGGAAGGGKSFALLMAASQFLNVPGYSALILRKTFADLNREGALMDIADEWWRGQPGVRFDSQNHKYIFACPDGGTSTVEFGGLDTVNDRLKYQGGRYNFVAYDELTQFKETDYKYLFSRMRRPKEGALSRIPSRMRAATNPGGPGHTWVHQRFIARWVKWKQGMIVRPPRNFWPALLADNPQLDQEDYIQSMLELDPVTRAQLLRGDWNIKPEGRMFKRRWFKIMQREHLPTMGVRWVRFWDLASTEPDPTKRNPDYTVGALVGRDARGRYFVADIKRWRYDPGDNDRMMAAVCALDTRRVIQVMEQEPGASGKVSIHHYRTQVFEGMNFRGVPATGSKIVRAGPVASHADAGNVYIIGDGSWNVDDLLDELDIFPDDQSGGHDDQVDGLSGAFSVLAKLHMGALNFDGVNEEFYTENPWRPEAQQSFTIGDLDGAFGRRLVDQSKTEYWTPDMVRSETLKTWAV